MKNLIKVVIILLCVVLLGVVIFVGWQQSKVNNNGSSSSQVSPEKDDISKENQVTPTGKIIKPLTGSMDLVNFEDETFNASFKATDIKDIEGELKIEMEVYQTNNYDAVEISNLKIGDKIVFSNKEVLVEAIDNSDGVIKINGGTSVEGYCLESIGGGVYSQIKDDKMPVYISVGKMSLKVDQDFKLVDNTEPDDGRTYFAGELFDLMKTSRVFDVNNTTGRVANGMLVEVICN